jgi:hypothetical protein
MPQPPAANDDLRERGVSTRETECDRFASPNTRILDLPHRTLHITPDVIIAIDPVGPLRPFHIRQQQEDTHLLVP